MFFLEILDLLGLEDHAPRGRRVAQLALRSGLEVAWAVAELVVGSDLVEGVLDAEDFVAGVVVLVSAVLEAVAGFCVEIDAPTARVVPVALFDFVDHAFAYLVHAVVLVVRE